MKKTTTLLYKTMLAFFMLSLFARDEVQADSSCDCIDVSTYKAPNNQTRYTISCYLKGEKRETLEEGQLDDAKLITLRGDSFKVTYKVPSCIWFPGNKRIAPSNK